MCSIELDCFDSGPLAQSIVTAVPGGRWRTEKQKEIGDQVEPSKSSLSDLLPQVASISQNLSKLPHQLRTKGPIYELVWDISNAKYSVSYGQNLGNEFNGIVFNSG